MLQWRRFQFFQRRPFETPAGMEVAVACASAGRCCIFLGDAFGVVHIVNREQNVTEFQAHDTVTYICRVPGQNVLMTIGLDMGTDLPPATIKFWRLNADEADPILAHDVRVFASPKLEQAPITCFALQDDLSQIALGMGNGAVVLFSGDLMRGRYKTYRLRHGGPCVTSVHFMSSSVLFVTTTSSVSSYMLLQDGHPEVVLDKEEGCDMNCSCLSDTGALAVGRSSGVFFYEFDDVGPCYGLESSKKSLNWFHTHLVIVSENKNLPNKSDVTAFDLRNKFIAFSGTFDPIANLLVEWGNLIIYLKQQPVKLFELSESDLTTKMDILFKRNLFSIATSLANSQSLDQSYIMEIVQRHGDHLYDKGDYQGAMREYLDTITTGVAHLEPSYVIRRFLDARLSQYLTAYLEALHDNSCATKLHTTLLLNCFTRAKLDEKLTSFLNNTASDKFDVDNAIQVCSSAGYLEHALQLAMQNNKIDASLKILIRIGDFPAIVEFIAGLPFGQAESHLKTHGYLLFDQAPDETIALLNRLCTQFLPGQDRRANPEEFIHLFVGKPDALTIFLETVVAETPNSSSTVYTTLLELYLRDQVACEDKILNLLATQQTKYDAELALVLTKRYGFTPGVLFLYQKLKLFVDILEHHIQCEDIDAIIETCQQYGAVEPNLWLRALSLFASNVRYLERPENIQHVLKNIRQSRLLPPLMVIQILSKNESVSLSVVKEFLLESLTYDQTILEEDQKQIEEYRAETAIIKERIHKLETQPISFQATVCSLCSGQLSEPPIFHFLCMHSFHERCIESMVSIQCPICYDHFKKVSEIDQAMHASANDHETFFHKIQDAEDGFATVAEYFGRGIIENHPTNRRAHPSSPVLSRRFE